jgi:hypothetical protein
MAYRYESQTIGRVVIGLVAIGLTAIVSITWLAWQKIPPPDALATAAGVAVGALATLLTTFTPSPIPGGRRAADAGTAPTIAESSPSTTAPAGLTVGPSPSGADERTGSAA